jgi:hypothetical protein
MMALIDVVIRLSQLTREPSGSARVRGSGPAYPEAADSLSGAARRAASGS